MNAIGASELVRTICASAGIAGVVATQGVSPEVDPEEWPHARYVLIWGWNPMSTAPHLWRKLLEARAQRRQARRRRPLPQPHREGRRRAPAPAPRDRRGAGAGDDARGPRRRPRRRGVVPRPHRRLRRAARAARRARRSSTGPGSAAWTRRRSPRIATRVRHHPAGAAAARRRRPAPPRSADRLPHARLPAGAGRRLAPPRRRLLLHPDGDRDAVPSAVLDGAELRAGRSRRINMSQLGEALTDPRLDPPVKALVVWSSNPAQIAPDQERVLAGLRREDLFTGRARAVHDRHRAPRRRRPAGDDPARAPRRASSPGATTTSPSTSRRSSRSARRSRTPRPSGCSPRGWVSTTRRFSETDEELLERLLDGDPGGVALERPARARLAEDRPRPGARRRTPRATSAPRPGRLGLQRRLARRRRRRPAPLLRPAGRGRRRRARRALPARADHAEDPPLPQLDLRQPAPPALGAAGAVRGVNPDDAAARGIADGATVRVCNDRGSFSAPCRVSDDARPGVVVAPMGWWNGDYADGR